MRKGKTKMVKQWKRLLVVGLAIALFVGNFSGMTVHAANVESEGVVENVIVREELEQAGSETMVIGESQLIISDKGYQYGEDGKIVEEKDIHIGMHNLGHYC